MLGLIRDTLRLARDSLYWNSRKSWHLMRGRRNRCPCQVASDSGRARETGCEAVIGYTSPARFRHVCPLLSRRPDGDWVCSVDHDQVRPFWGRAAVLLGGSALASFLLLSLGALVLLRGIGYDVSYRQVAWPPAWGEFRVVQAELYRQRATVALSEGRLSDAFLLLANAYEFDPSHYPTGLQLAQLWQTGQPVLSDQTYARLLIEHPDHAADTAQAWFRALLARGDFGSVQRLAGQRLLHSGPSPSSAWLQAFVFSTRQLNNPAGLDVLLASPSLPPPVAAFLTVERELYRLPASERIEILTTAVREARDPFALFHWLNRLLQENRPDLVLPVLSSVDSPLGNRERLRLQLDALAIAGLHSDRAGLIRQLLQRPLTLPVCELLSSHLAAHPEPTLLAAYAEQLASQPLPPGDASYPQLLAFFAVCGAHRDAALMESASSWLDEAAGRQIAFLPAARELFARLPASARLENILPALQPMPLETTYALYARLSPPPPFPE